jgi:hypothetical protein
MYLCGNYVPQWGAESSFAGQWLPAAGGDGAWAVRTGSVCDVLSRVRFRLDVFVYSFVRKLQQFAGKIVCGHPDTVFLSSPPSRCSLLEKLAGIGDVGSL